MIRHGVTDRLIQFHFLSSELLAEEEIVQGIQRVDDISAVLAGGLGLLDFLIENAVFILQQSDQ